ncbi:hypothetical protein [Streptomyces violaceusniger]|uniref:hypothetical protein n=1 Tax=Streptomyces violaceusniger TaxID=68280 RepID=UPI003826D9AE
MPTQTQQTTGPAAQQQGSHHFILTLQMPQPDRGYVTATFAGTFTPRPGDTRADSYEVMREQITQAHPHLERANVLFFSLERNQL